MLKKQIYNKQSGMTAIMLAMFLAIVISLLAVGFATLVRKDQTATLDKTLSYQAQYAAESGINKIISYIDSTSAPATRQNCEDTVSDTNAPDSSFSIGQAQITCAVWTNPTNTKVSTSSDKAQAFSFKTKGPINISWPTAPYDSPTAGRIPELDDTKKVLVITIANINDQSNYKRFYLVPNIANDGNLNFSTNPSGTVDYAKVSGSDAEVKITGFGQNDEYIANITQLNGVNGETTDVEISGNSGYQNTSQYLIDVNAKSLDITKRIQVFYSRNGSVGPNYVGSILGEGTICKDYKVDGTQGTTLSGASPCPNITPPNP